MLHMMFVAIVCLFYVSFIFPSACVHGQDSASSTSSTLRGGNKRDFIAPLDGITDVGGVLADTYTLVSREIVKFITDLVADPITVKLANTVARNVVNGIDRLLQLSFVEDFLDSNEINFFAANREEMDQIEDDDAAPATASTFGKLLSESPEEAKNPFEKRHESDLNIVRSTSSHSNRMQSELTNHNLRPKMFQMKQFPMMDEEKSVSKLPERGQENQEEDILDLSSSFSYYSSSSSGYYYGSSGSSSYYYDDDGSSTELLGENEGVNSTIASLQSSIVHTKLPDLKVSSKPQKRTERVSTPQRSDHHQATSELLLGPKHVSSAVDTSRKGHRATNKVLFGRDSRKKKNEQNSEVSSQAHRRNEKEQQKQRGYLEGGQHLVSPQKILLKDIVAQGLNALSNTKVGSDREISYNMRGISNEEPRISEERQLQQRLEDILDTVSFEVTTEYSTDKSAEKVADEDVEDDAESDLRSFHPACLIPIDKCNPNNVVCPLVAQIQQTNLNEKLHNHPTNFDPVCGCDGKTYSNACFAENFGCVTTWTPGPCCSASNPSKDRADK